MSKSQNSKFITWIKPQWKMPNIWLGKARFLGIAFLGVTVIGCGSKTETKVDIKKDETTINSKKDGTKAEPNKVEVKTETVKEKDQIKEEPKTINFTFKLPYSKEDI